MKIELYTRDSCKTCAFTKKILQERHIAFTEYKVGTDIHREKLLEMFPGARLLPLVVIDGDYIGTKENLFAYLQGEQKDVGTAA